MKQRTKFVNALTLRSNLLNWYDRERRTMPWRANPGGKADPYHVWLSEVMLQQTTVQAVIPYFKNFLEIWPTVNALADAPLDDVLEAWAGLGYYARARNLHACAQAVTTLHGGSFPSTVAALKALPGIGDYTAAAIAAIAFDTPATVVDGNVERVITRLARIKTPLPKAKKEVKDFLSRIAPETSEDRPGDFAQATMDLGATICTPKSPGKSDCDAFKIGDMQQYPVKPPKKTKPTRHIVAFWLQSGADILLERRPPKGLLGGMPGFFTTPWEVNSDIPADWHRYAPMTGAWTLSSDEALHTFTHFHLRARLAVLDCRERINPETGFWQARTDLSGLPTAFTKIAALKSE